MSGWQAEFMASTWEQKRDAIRACEISLEPEDLEDYRNAEEEGEDEEPTVTEEFDREFSRIFGLKP